MRKTIVAANWKMNNTVRESLQLIEQIKPLVSNATCDIVVCPPATALQSVAEAISGTNIKLGAQNVHFEPKGAFTGEISAEMLLEFGVEYVIVGHSERRQFFGETDETVNLRAKFALECGLQVIVCVGETLRERNAGKTEEVLDRQIRDSLKGITDFSRVIVAYEPVWAIGTGMAASIEQADEAIVFIRKSIAKYFTKASADVVRIQYGGSVTPCNAELLFEKEDIDGGLIGGASLDAEAFGEIIKEAK